MRAQFVFIFAKDKDSRLCQVLFCRNLLNKKNHDTRVCATCRSRRWRLLHPLKDKFNHLKSHAGARNIQFKLSFEEFLDFCNETGYGTHGGKDLDSDNVDRIKQHIGYVRDNICLKSLSENSSKGYHERKMIEKYNKTTVNAQPLDPDNEPF